MTTAVDTCILIDGFQGVPRGARLLPRPDDAEHAAVSLGQQGPTHCRFAPHTARDGVGVEAIVSERHSIAGLSQPTMYNHNRKPTARLPRVGAQPWL
jgi:hypothetical protein